MSAYYNYNAPVQRANVHHGRNRRPFQNNQNPQNTQRQFRPRPGGLKGATEDSSFLREYEAAISFDDDDDEKFIPCLGDDSSETSGSDRSSLASISPHASPTQFRSADPVLSWESPAFVPFNTYNNEYPREQSRDQPRSRNAIPIVDPSTRMSTSPERNVGRW